MFDTFLLHLGYVVRVTAVIALIATVLPKMYLEAKHKNGLNNLRKILFILGVTKAVIVSFSFLFAICMGYINGCRTIGGAGSLLNSIGDLTMVLFLYIIYNRKY